MSFVAHNPTSGPVAAKMALAQRPDTLQDGVLGVIDNGKTNSDTVLDQIVEGLKSCYQLTDVIAVRKERASHAIAEDKSRILAQKCDFVIAGIGD